MRKDVNCPYCDHPQDINHDDGYGYEENELHQQQCSRCSKYFCFDTSIRYSYEAYKADCLNGSTHKWKPTNTFPKEWTKMECTECGKYKNPTSEERIAFDIPEHENQ